MIRIAVLVENGQSAQPALAALAQDTGLAVTVVDGAAARGLPGDTQVAVFVSLGSLDPSLWEKNQPGKGRVLLLVDLAGEVGIDQAVALGARGYVGPRESMALLPARVRRLSEGKTAFPPLLASRIRATAQRIAAMERGVDRLPDRQLRLIRWVARGLTAKKIARRLGSSDEAARGRLRRLMANLHVKNERELCALAGETGLYAPGEDEPATESAEA